MLGPLALHPLHQRQTGRIIEALHPIPAWMSQAWAPLVTASRATCIKRCMVNGSIKAGVALSTLATLLLQRTMGVFAVLHSLETVGAMGP